jgi:hypothetical protein
MFAEADTVEIAAKIFGYGCALLLLAMIGSGIYLAVVFPFTDAGRRQKLVRQGLRQQIEASRRVELIGSERWEVVTKPHTLLRNKKMGQNAAILSRGGQSDPWTEHGKLVMRPRWVRVQPLTKDLIPSKGAKRWTQTQAWDVTGVVHLHWKDRLASASPEKALNNA